MYGARTAIPKSRGRCYVGGVILRAALLVACAAVASCANVECTLNSECGPSARCELNRCVRDCRLDRDCADGEVCSVNGACVPATSVDRPLDDASDDAPVSVDTPATPDVPVTPDAPVTPDRAVSPDVPATPDVPVTPDVPATPDVPDAPRDTANLDVPGLDTISFDAPAMDAAVDTSAPDATTMDAPRMDASMDGPVGVGVYDYTAVRPGALVAPVSAAWHPDGSYALILSSTDTVFRYDPAAMTVTQVASAGSGVIWRFVTFSPDGSRALLLGNTVVTGSTVRGRMFVWTSATSTLAENTAEAWASGQYESLKWNFDGTRGALLGRTSTVTTVWPVTPEGTRGTPIARGMVSNTGCNDVAWVRDGFGDPALAITCGVNTAEIVSVTSPFVAGTAFTTAVAPGRISNVFRIGAHPSGRVALAAGQSGPSRLAYFRDGLWLSEFANPQVPGAFGVAFNSDGSRAVAFGGAGRVHEFRYDRFSSAEITDVSIAGWTVAPFLQPTGSNLADFAWRPGCDEAVAVGGANTTTTRATVVVKVRVVNGRACP